MKQKFSLTIQKTGLIIGLILCGILYFFYQVSDILFPFVLAFVFAYLLHPAVKTFEKYGLSRGFATTLVMGLFILFVLSVVFVIVPILETQIFMLLSKAPAIVLSLWEHVKELILYTKENITQEQLSKLSGAVSQSVLSVINSIASNALKVVSGGFVFFNVVSMFMITPIILFYILRDWKDVEKQISSFIPKKKEKEILNLWQEINTTLSGFIRGQSAVCLLLGLYYAAGLSLIGLDYGLLVGFLSGILSFIPYFGFLTGVVLSVVLGISMHASLSLWIAMCIVFVIGQILEGYVLTPKLVGQKVGLHPVWVIFALFSGGALFGFVGILIAVPTAAVIGIVIRHLLKWYHTTALYNDKGTK